MELLYTWLHRSFCLHVVSCWIVFYIHRWYLKGRILSPSRPALLIFFELALSGWLPYFSCLIRRFSMHAVPSGNVYWSSGWHIYAFLFIQFLSVPVKKTFRHKIVTYSLWKADVFSTWMFEDIDCFVESMHLCQHIWSISAFLIRIPKVQLPGIVLLCWLGMLHPSSLVLTLL